MRELSLGAVNPTEVLRVWWQEVSVGLINGLVLGVLIGLVGRKRCGRIPVENLGDDLGGGFLVRHHLDRCRCAVERSAARTVPIVPCNRELLLLPRPRTLPSPRFVAGPPR